MYMLPSLLFDELIRDQRTSGIILSSVLYILYGNIYICLKKCGGGHQFNVTSPKTFVTHAFISKIFSRSSCQNLFKVPTYIIFPITQHVAAYLPSEFGVVFFSPWDYFRQTSEHAVSITRNSVELPRLKYTQLVPLNTGMLISSLSEFDV